MIPHRVAWPVSTLAPCELALPLPILTGRWPVRWTNYTRQDREADARKFRELVDQEGIQLFVVGLPVHLSGQESAKSGQAREFGQWLGQVTGRPVEFFDERYTTADAEQMMLDANLTSRRRKKRRDMIAAQVMLAAYLESSSRGQTPPGPIEDPPP